MTQAGDLRHTLLVDSYTETPNDDGTYSETWTEVGTRKAAIEPLRGREYLEAMAVNADITHRLRLRYLSGLTSRYRFRMLDGRTFYPVAPPVDDREIHNWVSILVKEQS